MGMVGGPLARYGREGMAEMGSDSTSFHAAPRTKNYTHHLSLVWLLPAGCLIMKEEEANHPFSLLDQDHGCPTFSGPH